MGQLNGKVVDETNAPLVGYIVEIKSTALFSRPALYNTDSSGAFTADYKDGKGVEYRVFDPVKRILQSGKTDDPTTLSTITINSKDAAGWLATLGTGTPVPVRTGNNVELLIDNDVAWPKMFEVINNAQTKIQASQFEFYVGDCIEDITTPVPIGQKVDGIRLENVLLSRAAEDGITVNLLVHRGFLDKCGEVEKFFLQNNQIVNVRSVAKSFIAPLHSKMIIVDEKTALLLGSPWMQIFYNGQDHIIDDPRRGKENFTVGIEVPIHDVSCKIDGPAAADVRDAYLNAWDAGLMAPVGGKGDRQNGPPDSGTVQPADAGTVPVQIVRSIKAGDFPEIPNGETGILEAYQRAIGLAEDFIYLESQYITEEQIYDTLIAAMNRKTDLQLIMVMNDDVDAPTYKRVQRNLVDRLRREVTDSDTRVGVFELWTHGQGMFKKGHFSSPADGNALIRCYVHAKAAVIDDKWATVGSANLDGASLDQLKIFGEYGTALNTKERSWEVNAIFFNGIADQPASDLPSELRRRLWAEHLGITAIDDPALTTRPSGGWLSLWHQKALDKLKQFANPQTPQPQRVLFWDTACCSSSLKLVLAILKDVAGADLSDADKKSIETALKNKDNIEVLSDLMTFDFSTGQYK